MTLAFHPEAEAEFLAAIKYYEESEIGLGLDFALEVHGTLDRMLTHPMAWPTVDGGLRRCQVARFPYGIIYAMEADGIYILAIMHLHRQPEYWQQRR